MATTKGCTLSRTGPAKAEIFGSTFRETGDIGFIKRIMFELIKRPHTMREIKASLSGSPYSPRTVYDFVFASENMRLISRFRQKRKLASLSLWLCLDLSLPTSSTDQTD